MKKVLLTLFTAIVMLPFAANAATYTVAGSAAILNGDASWAQANEANDMTSEDGVNYKLEIKGISVEAGTYEFKVVEDHSWTNCWPGQNYPLTIAETAKYDIVYTFNVDTKDITATPTKVGAFEGSTDKTYTVAGSGAILGSDWGQTDTNNDMVKGDDGIYRLVKENVPLESKTYEYKVVVNHDWGTSYPFNNAKLVIAEAGNYNVTFTFNEDTHEVGATAEAVGAPAESFSIIFKTNAGWGDVYAYVWSGNGEKKVLGDWPGTKMSFNERYDQYELSFEAVSAPEKIIFNNGNSGEGNQTEDFDFENQKIYQYTVELPQPTTVTFDFTDPNFRANIGEAMADTKGFIYNETFTAGGASLQITAGSAPSRIYVDANRGQNLVTYTQYTTLTFKAPEGKAITKIEFTAAGNSNINKFTASSGAIEGMIWTGNADGVRFAQGGTSYLANAIVTLADKDATTTALPAIEYTECANIAAFNALEPGTYAKVTLTNAEVIGKSADGYSTVWMQDATGGCWMQYTSLNDKLSENSKVNGFFYVVKRATSGNPQMKEAEGTPASEFTAEGISIYTIKDGATIAAVNTAEYLNQIVRLTGCSFVATSATSGTLTLGDETITVNNGSATANQQMHKLEWEKGDEMNNVIIKAILVASSATDALKNQLLPLSMESAVFTVAGAFNTPEGSLDDPIFGKTWEPALEANDMTRGEDGIYTLSVKEVGLTASGSILYKVVKNHSWDPENWGFPEKENGNADYYVELPENAVKGVYNVTFKFNPVATFANGYQVDCEVETVSVTTGIHTVNADLSGSVIYNMQGVRLNKLQKGVNIVNGKKVVIQ